MNILKSSIALLLLVILQPVYAEEQIINLSAFKSISAKRFHDIAKNVMEAKKFRIEQDSTTSLVGALKRYKVQIELVKDQKIVVRWVPNYAGRRDTWIRGLKTDILWKLAE